MPLSEVSVKNMRSLDGGAGHKLQETIFFFVS